MSPVLRFQWLPSLLDWLALPSLLAIPANRGGCPLGRGRFRVIAGFSLGWRSCLIGAPLLPLLPALPAIALLLAIAAHRASQLRMRRSACSIQTTTGLRTFNPKVVGSSPTGGTGRLGPGRDRGLTRPWDADSDTLPPSCRHKLSGCVMVAGIG